MEPGELNVDTRLGTLTINGYSCFQPHFTISNPQALLDLADLRGGDRLVPHAVGVKARRRRRTVTRKDFPVALTGWCTPAGVRVPASQRYQQLIDNRDEVVAALGIGEDAPAGVTGTVAAVWTLPDATTKSAAVHVLTPWRLEMHQFVLVGVLSISVPAGRFT